MDVSVTYKRFQIFWSGPVNLFFAIERWVGGVHNNFSWAFIWSYSFENSIWNEVGTPQGPFCKNGSQHIRLYLKIQTLPKLWDGWKTVDIWKLETSRGVPNYKVLALRFIYGLSEIMQWPLGYYLDYRWLEWSKIIYSIYILDIFCLVLHVPQALGYLITNFGGSTMKNKLLATCQAIGPKMDKTRHIRCEPLYFRLCFLSQFYTLRWILVQIVL